MLLRKRRAMCGTPMARQRCCEGRYRQSLALDRVTLLQALCTRVPSYWGPQGDLCFEPRHLQHQIDQPSNCVCKTAPIRRSKRNEQLLMAGDDSVSDDAGISIGLIDQSGGRRGR